MQSDILLINPPYGRYGKLKKIRKHSPPLGILYVATCLRSKGYRVGIIDTSVEPERITAEAIARLNVKVAGITCSTPAVGSALKIAGKIKNYHPDTAVVLGGAHASVCYEELIKKDFVDYVVVGEGELSFENICKSVVKGGRIDDYSGIVAKNADKCNPEIKLIEDLDSIPFPDRGLIPFDRYELSPINYKQKPSTPIITSRGCPFGCSFCSNPVHGKKVRLHSPEYIIEEIRYLIRDFKVRDIMFWDDTFTFNNDRVEKLCSLMIDNGFGLSWGCATRVDRIDEGLLKTMKRAGCWQISLGVETGSERLLKTIRKGINRQQIITAFELCKKIGIQTRAFFILGIPTETVEESYETLKFAKSLNPSFVQFTLAVPYPGSEFYNQAVNEGWQPPDWEKFSTYPEDKPVYIPEGRDARELKQLQTRAFKEFYFRPSYLLNRLMSVASFSDLLKHVKVAYYLLKMGD